MKVSVVFEDGAIVVDKVAQTGFDLSSVDPNWRALQWADNRGWIEVHNGERIWLKDLATVQPFIDMHTAAVEAPPPPEAPPQVITSLQFRREVKARNKVTQFKNWLGTASEDVRLYFEFTDRINTTDPEFMEFVSLLGLTPTQVENFFISAAAR
jgi:hypothetical protein